MIFKYKLSINKFNFNLYNYSNCKLKFSKNAHQKPPWKILFFGSDIFSLSSFTFLIQEYRRNNLISKLDVVTNPKSIIDREAKKLNISVFHWPNYFPNNYDIGLVVSFGHMIPEKTIEAFPMEMINIHASLLPKWRGASPIIYSLMNGETKTGVTAMKIKPNKFDIGEIIDQRECEINSHETAIELTKNLSLVGADLLMDVIKRLPNCLNDAKLQPTIGISYAPKITTSLSNILWNKMSAKNIYDLYRALAGKYPLSTNFNGICIKFYEIKPTSHFKNDNPGRIIYDKISQKLYAVCKDNNLIYINLIRINNRKKMNPQEFYNGYLSKISKDKWIFD